MREVAQPVYLGNREHFLWHRCQSYTVLNHPGGADIDRVYILHRQAVSRHGVRDSHPRVQRESPRRAKSSQARVYISRDGNNGTC